MKKFGICQAAECEIRIDSLTNQILTPNNRTRLSAQQKTTKDGWKKVEANCRFTFKLYFLRYKKRGEFLQFL